MTDSTQLPAATATPKTISVLVGSLRRGSYARQIARNAMTFFPENWDVRIVEIGHLPLYNFDYDDPAVEDVATPDDYIHFRRTIADSDGILFVTPENNRCIPACLKNAVDIGSKPNTDVAWKHKPAGIISHSVGKMGGYSAHKNLRLALSYFDMPMLGQPEVFLGQSPELLSKDSADAGEPANAYFVLDSTRNFVRDYIARFTELVELKA